jgi:hypothetical protein
MTTEKKNCGVRISSGSCPVYPLLTGGRRTTQKINAHPTFFGVVPRLPPIDGRETYDWKKNAHPAIFGVVPRLPQTQFGGIRTPCTP